MEIFLDMSDVQYVQYWTKYVQYWTNTAISQQQDYGHGWFWCQNYCQLRTLIYTSISVISAAVQYVQY